MGEVKEFGPGWSIARLAEEFGRCRNTVSARIRQAGVAPIGKRNGYEVYRMADVAPLLVDPGALLDLGGLDPRDLPPLERRAFYQSENERIKVETTTGRLVTAAEVEANMAAGVRMVVTMLETLPDVLERDCALRPEQIMRVQESCDRVRQVMYEAVTDFETPEGAT